MSFTDIIKADTEEAAKAAAFALIDRQLVEIANSLDQALSGGPYTQEAEALEAGRNRILGARQEIAEALAARRGYQIERFVAEYQAGNPAAVSLFGAVADACRAVAIESTLADEGLQGRVNDWAGHARHLATAPPEEGADKARPGIWQAVALLKMATDPRDATALTAHFAAQLIRASKYQQGLWVANTCRLYAELEAAGVVMAPTEGPEPFALTRYIAEPPPVPDPSAERRAGNYKRWTTVKLSKEEIEAEVDRALDNAEGKLTEEQAAAVEAFALRLGSIHQDAALPWPEGFNMTQKLATYRRLSELGISNKPEED